MEDLECHHLWSLSYLCIHDTHICCPLWTSIKMDWHSEDVLLVELIELVESWKQMQVEGASHSTSTRKQNIVVCRCSNVDYTWSTLTVVCWAMVTKCSGLVSLLVIFRLIHPPFVRLILWVDIPCQFGDVWTDSWCAIPPKKFIFHRFQQQPECDYIS